MSASRPEQVALPFTRRAGSCATALLCFALGACAPPVGDGSEHEGAGSAGDPAGQSLTTAEHLAGAENRELVDRAVAELARAGCPEIDPFADSAQVAPHAEFGLAGSLGYRAFCGDSERSAGLLLAFGEDGEVLMVATSVGTVAEQSDGRKYYTNFRASLETVSGAREIHDRFSTFDAAWILAAEELYGTRSEAQTSFGAGPNLGALGIAESKGSAEPGAVADPRSCGFESCQECMAEDVTGDAFAGGLCSQAGTVLRFGAYGASGVLVATVLTGPVGWAAVGVASLAALATELHCDSVRDNIEAAPKNQAHCADSGCCEPPQCHTPEDCTPVAAAEAWKNGEHFMSHLYKLRVENPKCGANDDGRELPDCYREGGECERDQETDTFFCK